MKICFSFSEHLKLYWHTFKNYFEIVAQFESNFEISHIVISHQYGYIMIYFHIQYRIFFHSGSIIRKHVMRYSVREGLRTATLILSILNKYYILAFLCNIKKQSPADKQSHFSLQLLTTIIWSPTWILPSCSTALPFVMLFTKIPEGSGMKKQGKLS